ncbi:pseudouridine synthase, partial [Protomyces lactucae-debilis]
KEDRKPKRKVACMIGYCGTGYSGMQFNTPQKTIEGTLFAAFVKAGAISADNANDPKKVSLLRAARTDKGVHAACNVISLKLIVEEAGMLDKINSCLPAEIRLWKIVRTMNSFNPRTSCDSRRYEYLIPTSVFIPSRPGDALSDRAHEFNQNTLLKDSASTFWAELDAHLQQLRQSEAYCRITDDTTDLGNIALDRSIPDEEKPAAAAKMKREKMLREAVHAYKRAYRISPERLTAIRQTLAIYEGTKNFHNYTIGQEFKQASSKRVIRSFDASEPFLIDGTEWFSLKIHGQSFMLHQIRKMVAMVMLVMLSGCPLDRMQKTFGPTKVNIPKAPSLGLLLERPVFEQYGLRAIENGKEALNVDDMADEMQSFKHKYIYDKLYAEEISENTFFTYLGGIEGF